uniref:Uncharacterized protein n=1 Tax=Arundo donax TaxID=35708 RepID=A0A0A8YF84_ARUDO
MWSGERGLHLHVSRASSSSLEERNSLKKPLPRSAWPSMKSSTALPAKATSVGDDDAVQDQGLVAAGLGILLAPAVDSKGTIHRRLPSLAVDGTLYPAPALGCRSSRAILGHRHLPRHRRSRPKTSRSTLCPDAGGAAQLTPSTSIEVATAVRRASGCTAASTMTWSVLAQEIEKGKGAPKRRH